MANDGLNRHLRRPALSLLLLAGLPACQRGESHAASAEKLPRVEVVKAARHSFRGLLPITGELKPVQEVTMKSRIGGNVVELNFDEGDAVKKGQLIARIEDITPRANLRAAEAQVALAEAQVQRAEADLERLGRDRHRIELLHQRGAADQKSLDDSLTNARLGEVAVRTAQAQLQQARAQRDAAQNAVAETQYRAPFDGVISRRGVALHEYIDTFKNRDIVSIVDTSAMELYASVAADLAAGVEKGARVDFRINAFPGRVFSGEVLTVNPVVDPKTRTIRLRVRLPNAEGKLKGGMYATGMVAVGGERSGVGVPAAAVHYEAAPRETEAGGIDESAIVWRVRGGVAERRPVHTGARDGDVLEVLDGLAEGDLVVRSSPAALRAGLKVASNPIADGPGGGDDR